MVTEDMALPNPLDIVARWVADGTVSTVAADLIRAVLGRPSDDTYDADRRAGEALEAWRAELADMNEQLAYMLDVIWHFWRSTECPDEIDADQLADRFAEIASRFSATPNYLEDSPL